MTSWEDGSRSVDGRTSLRFKPYLPVCFLACLSGELLCLPLRAQEPQATQETQQTTPEDTPKPDMPMAKDRDVSWRTLPRNFLQDQKEIWLFPTQLAKGRHWLPTDRKSTRLNSSHDQISYAVFCL